MIQISLAFPLIGLAPIGNYKLWNLRYDELEISDSLWKSRGLIFSSRPWPEDPSDVPEY